MNAVPEPTPDRLEISYQKSAFFRVIHADGCFGGINPRGMVHCAFYSERNAIPRRTAIPIVDGRAGPEEVVESRSGLVRELEVDVLMDLNTSVAFYIWLRDKMEHLRKQLGISDDQRAQTLRETTK